MARIGVHTHTHKLKKLDCDLALLQSEPIYGVGLETRDATWGRIMQSCELGDEVAVREMGMKKIKNKK